MTTTTDRTTVGGPADAVWVEESFRRYAFDGDAASVRTDTPDLMRVFTDALDEVLLAEGYRELAEFDRMLADADMAASFDSLPE